MRRPWPSPPSSSSPAPPAPRAPSGARPGGPTSGTGTLGHDGGATTEWTDAVLRDHRTFATSSRAMRTRTDRPTPSRPRFRSSCRARSRSRGAPERSRSSRAERDAHQRVGRRIIGASGVDAAGPWTLEGGSGVVERQRGIEGIEPALDAWLLRRSYVEAFDSARDKARCEDVGCRSDNGPRVSTSRSRDPSSARRFSPSISRAPRSSRRGTRRQTASRRAPPTRHGRSLRPRMSAGLARPRSIPSWATPRPRNTARSSRGLACARFDASGVAIPVQGDACAAPLPDRFVVRWPAGDRPRVRLPLTYLGSELLVRAKLGGRDVHRVPRLGRRRHRRRCDDARRYRVPALDGADRQRGDAEGSPRLRRARDRRSRRAPRRARPHRERADPGARRVRRQASRADPRLLVLRRAPSYV